MRIKESEVYTKWFKKLRDDRAKYRIKVRIRRLEMGNPGNVEPVGEGVSEMKIDYGQGYRVYYKDTGREIILLLCGSSAKKTQQADIAEAKKIARDYKEEVSHDEN